MKKLIQGALWVVAVFAIGLTGCLSYEPTDPDDEEDIVEVEEAMRPKCELLCPDGSCAPPPPLKCL